MAMCHLTERFVENITMRGTPRFPPDQWGRLEIGDLVVQGLCLRISQRGAKSWSFVYRVPEIVGGRYRAGKQRRITFGDYPAITLKAAREIAVGYGEELVEGRDPATSRAPTAPTIAAVVEEYITKCMVPRVRCPETPRRILEKHVVSRWGDRLITDISRGDVAVLLDEVKETVHAELAHLQPNPARRKLVGVGAARETRRALSAMFNWAMDREYVPLNPLVGLRRPDLAESREVREPLGDERIRALWAMSGLAALPQLRMILLTGCRKVEWGHARWDELDLDRGLMQIPAHRHKGKRDTTIPLNKPALALLAQIPRRKPEVFGVYLSTCHLRPIHKRLGWVIRPHDLRATCATRMGQLRVPEHIIHRCLGHSVVSADELLARYNKHDYLDECREAFERYGQHIMEVVG